MKIISKIEELRKELKNYKGETLGLVPTMGALHNGHKSLIEASVKSCNRTVVSVFVNPVQFSEGEDYDKYPRTLDADGILCESLGVDIIFAPTPSEMYSDKKNNMTLICPSFFDTDKLCGKTRLGHFDGVATVVGKLFNIVKPNKAFFGKKDAQQLFIIKKMVRDLNFDIEIVPCPIVREESGLALSSRNSYLSENDKKEAQKINYALNKVKELFKSGITSPIALSDVVFAILPQNSVEYFEVVNENTFEIYQKNDTIETGAIALVAVKINGVRLIDNIDL